MAWVVSQEFARMAEGSGRYRVTFDAQHSSGLVRPDYIDWPQRIANSLRLHRFDAVLLTFGTNDAERLPWQGALVDPNTTGWNAAYRVRVDAVLQLARGDDRRVFWVGLPVMRAPAFSARIRGFNQVFREAVGASPRSVYVDTWRMFVDPTDAYTAWMPLDTPTPQLVRATDGIHYTRLGARHLARHLLSLLDRTYYPSPR